MDDDFLDDDGAFGGVMDPINLKKRKNPDDTGEEDEGCNQTDFQSETENENEPKKKRPIEGEEEDDAKDDENKDEEQSFDISSSESEQEEDDGNFDVFEKMEPNKTQVELVEKDSKNEQQKNEVKPSSSKTEVSVDKKKGLSIDTSGQELAKKKKIEQIEEENKKMQVLMANFSEEQLNRYETFRRSAFQKSSIKKIIQTVCGKTVSQSVVIAMSGISKVFVGEIIEKALDVKDKWGDTGPLQPKHLREAFRLFKNSNRLATSSKSKKPSLF